MQDRLRCASGPIQPSVPLHKFTGLLYRLLLAQNHLLYVAAKFATNFTYLTPLTVKQEKHVWFYFANPNMEVKKEYENWREKFFLLQLFLFTFCSWGGTWLQSQKLFRCQKFSQMQILTCLNVVYFNQWMSAGRNYYMSQCMCEYS